MSPETFDVPTRTYETGTVIFREGDASTREAYLIQSGVVEVRRETGADWTCRTLVAGDLLGEVALFGDAPHSATAVVVESATVLVIAADRLEGMVRSSPALALALIRQLARMAAGGHRDGDR